VEAVGSMAVRLGWRCAEAETEDELRWRERDWAGWLGPARVGSSGSCVVWGFVEDDDMDVVEATEEEWARRAESSRVSLFT
jgi:hypothetical protein